MSVEARLQLADDACAYLAAIEADPDCEVLCVHVDVCVCVAQSVYVYDMHVTRHTAPAELHVQSKSMHVRNHTMRVHESLCICIRVTQHTPRAE